MNLKKFIPSLWSEDALRGSVVDMAGDYAQLHIGGGGERFVAGETYIPPSGKVIGRPEIENAVSAVLDGWLTEGEWVARFEKALASYVGVRRASMTNSGSSANLLAISALRSQELLKPGNEIITAATGFPTTINPILQNNFRPVFVDVEIGTYVPSVQSILDALSPNTRAIFMAHTLGNPFPMETVLDALDGSIYDVDLIEDNCDALGSIYKGKLTGTFGLMATQSFYPAHHITTGEGGAVLTQSPKVQRAVEKFRDWGRDCWCDPGKENTCGKRFDWNFPGLPRGYDHKYVYSEVGYNLKSTDLQAAIGMAQLDRIDGFVEKRRRNFDYLSLGLASLEKYLILPEETNGSSPSWFGFPITVRESAPFGRDDIVAFLNDAKIGTRNLFGGNLINQPAYAGYDFRVIGDLENADRIARDTFWIGVYPGISLEMLDYVIERFHEFAKGR